MSRSIHDTHGVLRQILREDYADPELQRALAREVRGNLRRQRRIKKRLQEQRGRDRRPPLAPVDPDLAPIVVEDTGPYVHHAATPEDIREVLRRMPPGSLDGLGPIVLCLGQPRHEDMDDPPDPHLGRRSHAVLPGVYGVSTRGIYDESDCSVRLHAFVHAPGAPGPLAIFLKLRALATLVHELSHHFDFAFRTRGDRWRMDDRDKDEGYATSEAFERVRTCVVPYLEERFPDECAAFRRWEAQHARHALPLAAFTDDRDGKPSADLALAHLASDVADGSDPFAARITYAQALEICGHPEDNRQILDAILAELPDDPAGSYLRAHIVHQRGQYDLAEAACRAALAGPNERDDAELLLARVLRSMARWEELVAHTTPLLARGNRPARADLLGLRARASLELARWDAAVADIAALRQDSDADAGREADTLDALRLGRTGSWREALAAAERLLRTADLGGRQAAEARAVRLESALRLGRTAQLQPLGDRDIAALRRSGHGPWIDRLLRPASDP